MRGTTNGTSCRRLGGADATGMSFHHWIMIMMIWKSVTDVQTTGFEWNICLFSNLRWRSFLTSDWEWNHRPGFLPNMYWSHESTACRVWLGFGFGFFGLIFVLPPKVAVCTVCSSAHWAAVQCCSMVFVAGALKPDSWESPNSVAGADKAHRHPDISEIDPSVIGKGTGWSPGGGGGWTHWAVGFSEFQILDILSSRKEVLGSEDWSEHPPDPKICDQYVSTCFKQNFQLGVPKFDPSSD